MTATITVYTAPACMQCRGTTRHLDNAGADYRTADATTAENTRHLQRLGHEQVPVVQVDLPNGRDHWSGFRPDALDAAVAAQNGAEYTWPLDKDDN